MEYRLWLLERRGDCGSSVPFQFGFFIVALSVLHANLPPLYRNLVKLHAGAYNECSRDDLG